MGVLQAGVEPQTDRPSAHQLEWNHEGRPLVLYSDIDDTMVGPTPGHDAATSRFRALWEHTSDQHTRTLVYNTGRSLQLFLDIWSHKGGQQGVMPEPRYLICGVGTRIYHPAPGAQNDARTSAASTWVEDKEWTQHINHQWDVEVVRRVLQGLIQQQGPLKLHFAESWEQHTHKQTVRVDPTYLPRLLALLPALLEPEGVVPLLVSGAPPAGSKGWGYVDVLPARAGKGAAAEWLRSVRLGVPPECCVVAGDSQNDLQMLGGTHWGGALVVGNAVPPVMRWAKEQREARGEQDCNVRITCGHTADGLIEGLVDLGWLVPRAGSAAALGPA